jgi:ASCH domain
MMFITVYQPYAALLVSGRKTIERRAQGTPYRGPLAIHAGQKRLEVPPEFRPDVQRLPARLAAAAGCILGVVDLVDVRPAVEEDRHAMLADPEEHKRRMAWIVARPRLLPTFLPMRGEQQIRSLDATRAAAIEAMLAGDGG